MTGDRSFELARAITSNELELHYQPIFAIDGKSVQAVEALVRWKHPQKGLLPPQAFLVAVNIASSDLGDPRFVRLLDRTLQATAGTSGFSAEIRADETGEASGAGVRELGARGIPIALDDVTNVGQLDGVAGWPLNTLKLGREITGRAVDDTGAAEMAHGVAHVAHERGIALVAVGVETQATLDFARALGCVGAQGYGLARPMASRALVRWARERG